MSVVKNSVKNCNCSGIEVTRDANVINHGICGSDQDAKMFDEEIKNNSTNDVQSRCDQDISISRDDIVVTMRSVNV